MARRPYLTAPQPLTTMPPGIPYIVGNEAAERFSFYGMKAILTIYMIKYLRDWNGEPAYLSENNATAVYHTFSAAVYGLSLPGAILADWLWGKYPTILWLSIVYCLGHAALAFIPAWQGLLLGLVLIAIGSGGIKPCVSAHVGDQFGPQNQHLVTRVFGWFYFSINFGSFFAYQFNPIILDRGGAHWGPHLAFGLPGILMCLATFVFWLGRHRFAHIPPGGRAFLRESFGKEGRSAIFRLLPLYAFVCIFWALYDQTGSTWVVQAEKMDKRWLGIEWLSSQIGAVNPILVMAFIPLFNYVVFPMADRIWKLPELGKVAIGFFLTAGSFAVIAMIQAWIDQGLAPNIVWQLLAYAILTAGEVLVYGTCLEFSYTQAPNRMKSIIMAVFLSTVALGNSLTALINYFVVDEQGRPIFDGANYFWFFTGLMVVASVGFLAVAATYRGKKYIQQENAV
ncbi:MAG TPA: POT family MFS transporter [Planctomycetaceae bacterium]|nr:POT family MFS transporter [Planctomycetaceae bacterium]